MSPVFGRHGSMEGDESGVGKVSQQTGEVAVANDNFGMTPNGFEINSVQQVIRAVAAAGAEDGANVIALEHFFQFADAAIDRSCEIEIAVENRIEIERLVSRTPEGFASGREIGLLDIAGRRDDCNGIAGPEGGRLDELDIRGWHEVTC